MVVANGVRSGWKFTLLVVFFALWRLPVAAQSLEFESAEQGVANLPGPDAVESAILLTSPQTVRVGIGGELKGSVQFFSSGDLQSAPKGVAVRLMRDGKVIASTQTDKDGLFSLRRVEPGIHTIIAASADLLAAYALTVVTDDSASNASLELIAGNIPFSRARAVLAGLRRPVRNVSGDSVSGGIGARETSNSYRVKLDPAGGFRGQVSLPGRDQATVDFSGTMVRVYRNGGIIAESSVSSSGDYEVKEVDPGPVSVLIFGRVGFASLGVELVASDLQTSTQRNGKRNGNVGEEGFQLVSVRQDPVDSLNVELAPLSDIEEAVTEIEETSGDDEMIGTPIEIPPPLAGGGFAGAGAGPGFGGGGGGGSGMGGLAGLAALGATLAAALASGGDDDFTPEPASPATP